MTSLSLRSNSFTSTTPSQLGLLTKLELLDLGHNALNGSIPSEIGRLTTLTGPDGSDEGDGFF